MVLAYTVTLGQKTTAEIAHDVHQFLTFYPSVEHVEVYYHWNLVTLDPDDDKFADCAIASGADFLVTNDQHFQPLENVNFPRLQIINLDQFERAFSGNSFSHLKWQFAFMQDQQDQDAISHDLEDHPKVPY